MKKYALPIVLGIVGFALPWCVWHLHVDHQNLHGLINLVQQQQRQQQPARPAPPVSKPQESQP